MSPEPTAASAEPCDLIICDPAMHAVFARARRAAGALMPVLVFGETGTGKELVAQTLHREGPRGAGPFVPLNCGALPATLVESVLFGHVRGAFTGADRNMQGAFQLAHGGTLFLDEVGELSLATQVALLRALESGRIRPLGASDETRVDVRVVAATNRDLEAMVGEGRFRRDLLHRIDALTIVIPPLRDRPDEIEALARHFLELNRPARRNDRVVGFEPSALNCMRAHDWPGNVRELRNAVESAAALCEGTRISVADLPPRLRAVRARLPEAEPEIVPAAQQGDYRSRLRAYEMELLLDGLRRAHGNQCLAAQLLAMPRRTLCRRIKDLGLERAYTPRDNLI